MAFTVQSKSGPTILGPTGAAASARDRAIAKLMEGAPEQKPAPSVAPKVTPDGNSEGQEAAVAPQEPVSAKADPSPKEDQLTAHYTILARKEKALRTKAAQQEAAIKEREAALKAKEEEIAAIKAEYQSKYVPKEKLSKHNALQTLSEMGLTYDDLTELAIKAPSAQDVDRIEQLKAQIRAELQEELRPVKEAQERSRKEIEQRQADSYNQALNQIRSDARKLVKDDPRFEAVASEGDAGVNHVVELIEATFREGLDDERPKGTILSVEEAAQLIEDELIERYTKASQLKKIQERLASNKPKEEPKVAEESKAQTNQLTTLSNSVSSAPRLTARQRALLAFEGKLNK